MKYFRISDDKLRGDNSNWIDQNHEIISQVVLDRKLRHLDLTELDEAETEDTEKYLFRNALIDSSHAADGAWVPISVAMIAIRKVLDGDLLFPPKETA